MLAVDRELDEGVDDEPPALAAQLTTPLTGPHASGEPDKLASEAHAELVPQTGAVAGADCGAHVDNEKPG